MSNYILNLYNSTRIPSSTHFSLFRCIILSISGLIMANKHILLRLTSSLASTATSNHRKPNISQNQTISPQENPVNPTLQHYINRIQHIFSISTFSNKKCEDCKRQMNTFRGKTRTFSTISPAPSSGRTSRSKSLERKKDWPT